MSKALSLLVLAAATIARGQTLSLHDAVERALAHSPELHALEAGVAEARANAALGDAFRSSASVSATPGYATGLPTAVLGQVPAIATVEAHRLIYDRSARAEQLGATSQIDVATSRLESRKRELAESVAELWSRIGTDAALATSAQQRVAAYETIATRTEALRREGRARDLDADRAGLQVASAKRAAARAQSRLELDRLRLSRLVGERVEATASSEHEPAIAATALAQAVANDPEVRSLGARIETAQRALALTERLFQPTIAAQVQYSRLFDRFRRYYLNFTPDDFSVGATVSVPFWTGGHRAAVSERLAAQVQQLTAEREARRTEVELAISEAEAELTDALAERELAVRAQTVAEESLRVAEELAREGRGEVNDVPLGQVALADAADAVANARLHVVISRARLLSARGEMPYE